MTENIKNYIVRLIHKFIGFLTILVSSVYLLFFAIVLLLNRNTDSENLAFFFAFQTIFIFSSLFGLLGGYLWLKLKSEGWWLVLLSLLGYTYGMFSSFGTISGPSADVMQVYIPALKGQSILFFIPILAAVIFWIRPFFFSVLSPPFRKIVAFLLIFFAFVLVILNGINTNIITGFIAGSFLYGIVLFKKDLRLGILIGIIVLLTQVFVYWYPCFSGFEQTNVPIYNINPQTGSNTFTGQFSMNIKKGCGWD